MPQMGLGGQAAMSGLLQGLIGGYGQQRQRAMEKGRKGIEDQMKNLTSVINDYKQWQELDPSDPLRPLLERKMTLAYGRVPGEFQTPLQQRRRDYVKGVGPDVTGYREFEKIGAPTGAPPPVDETALTAQRARQMGWPTAAEKAAKGVTEKDIAKRKAAATTKIHAEALRQWRNFQAEKNAYESKLKTYTALVGTPEGIVARIMEVKWVGTDKPQKMEQRRQKIIKYGDYDPELLEIKILDEAIQTGGLPRTLPSREEFIQSYTNDPLNTQKAPPSEEIINQAKGVDWQ